MQHISTLLDRFGNRARHSEDLHRTALQLERRRRLAKKTHTLEEREARCVYAYIQLGGLRVGLDESAFVTFPEHLGNVINDDVILAGGYRTNLISYTFTGGNGFSAILSLEEGGNGDSGDVDVTLNDYAAHRWRSEVRWWLGLYRGLLQLTTLVTKSGLVEFAATLTSRTVSRFGYRAATSPTTTPVVDGAG